MRKRVSLGLARMPTSQYMAPLQMAISWKTDIGDATLGRACLGRDDLLKAPRNLIELFQASKADHNATVISFFERPAREVEPREIRHPRKRPFWRSQLHAPMMRVPFAHRLREGGSWSGENKRLHTKFGFVVTPECSNYKSDAPSMETASNTPTTAW